MTYRCKCHGWTVKEINEKFKAKSAKDDEAFVKGLPILSVVLVAIFFVILIFGKI